jgi:hypothetical protein
MGYLTRANRCWLDEVVDRRWLVVGRMDRVACALEKGLEVLLGVGDGVEL